MEDSFKETKGNLLRWMKDSWQQFKAIRQSFSEEWKKLLEEARQEYEKKKKP